MVTGGVTSQWNKTRSWRTWSEIK